MLESSRPFPRENEMYILSFNSNSKIHFHHILLYASCKESYEIARLNKTDFCALSAFDKMLRARFFLSFVNQQ